MRIRRSEGDDNYLLGCSEDGRNQKEDRHRKYVLNKIEEMNKSGLEKRAQENT